MHCLFMWAMGSLKVSLSNHYLSFLLRQTKIYSHFKFLFIECDSIRMFTCKKLRYYWDADRHMFRKLTGLDCDVTTADLHRQTGITAQEQIIRFVFA